MKETTTDNMGEFITITNAQKIANYNKLQKENEILKENAIHNDKVVDEARWNEMIYKSRIKKAIEYIEEHIKYECDDTFNKMQFYSYHLYNFDKKELLNILNGDDKE